MRQKATFHLVVGHKTTPFTLKVKSLTEALINILQLKADWYFLICNLKGVCSFFISTWNSPSWDIHARADVLVSPQAKCSAVSCWPRSYFHCPMALPLLSEHTSSLICWYADESHTDLDSNWTKNKCQWVTEYFAWKTQYTYIWTSTLIYYISLVC